MKKQQVSEETGELRWQAQEVKAFKTRDLQKHYVGYNDEDKKVLK
jgi:hypothetical protein